MTNQPPVLTDRLDRAFTLARTLHGGQVRKETAIPYLSHLMSVAAIVMEHGGDEDLAIAGLLHDGPEDAGGKDTLDEIRRDFGDRVASVVDECTDTYETPKPDWRPRKEAYLAHLPETSTDGLLVSAADKLHNARAILMDLVTHGPALFDRFNGKQEGTLWYYRSLVERFEQTGRVPPALLRELKVTVDAMCNLVPAAS
jgi:(p)ppGpp synthase/HD superfamily hydrolase